MIVHTTAIYCCCIAAKDTVCNNRRGKIVVHTTTATACRIATKDTVCNNRRRIIVEHTTTVACRCIATKDTGTKEHFGITVIIPCMNTTAIAANNTNTVYRKSTRTVRSALSNGQSVHHDAVGCGGNARYDHNVIAVVGTVVRRTNVAGKYGKIGCYIACTAAVGVTAVYLNAASGNGKGAVPVGAALYACGVISAFCY